MAYHFDTKKRPVSLFGKRGSGEEHVLYVFERGDGKLEVADEKPKTEHPRIVVAADKTPFRKEIKLAAGDTWIVVLPNDKTVTLWAEKDRLRLAEQKTRSGLQCWWREKPTSNRGPSSPAAARRRSAELFIGDWQLSYVSDLTSTPHLNVTVIVKKREAEKKEK